MKINNLTWLAFFTTLSTVSIAIKTPALDMTKSTDSNHQLNSIEKRLNPIADTLKAKEENLSSNEKEFLNKEILWGGFINGGGGFLNNAGGAAFLNNRGGWGDGGGGFLNRRF